jgi:hypothetical protein
MLEFSWSLGHIFSCSLDLSLASRSRSCWFCLIGPAAAPVYSSRNPVMVGGGGCDLSSGPGEHSGRICLFISTQTWWPGGEDDAAGGERRRRRFRRGGLPRTVPRRVQLRRRARRHQRTICINTTLYHHYGLVRVSLSPLPNHLQFVLIIFHMACSLIPFPPSWIWDLERCSRIQPPGVNDWFFSTARGLIHGPIPHFGGGEGPLIWYI